MGQAQAVRINLANEDIESSKRAPYLGDLTLEDRWEQCLSVIREELPPQTVQTWFLPIVPLSFTNNVLALRLPSRFFFEWIESHYDQLFKKAIAKVFDQTTQVGFIIANVESGESRNEIIGLPAGYIDESIKTTNPELVKPVRIMQQEAGDIDHRFCFDNFFFSHENNFPVKAALHVCDNVGTTNYNPLVIYGEIGSGKSHLLNACGNYISQKYSDIDLALLSSEYFLHEYVKALQCNRINKLIKTLTSLKALLLDDIQFLEKKKKSQEGLIFIITELVKRGAQVIITSNLPPNRLTEFNCGLISFLQKGLIVDLPSGDFFIREKIIRHHLQKNEISLDEKIIQYLADNLNQNIHQLNAIMVRIAAQISLLGKGLSLNEIRWIISQVCPLENTDRHSQYPRKEIGIDAIVMAVANYYDVPADVVQGVSRKQKIIRTRQIAIYLSRELTGESLNSIGYHFSNLHHASVLYAYNKVKNNMEKNYQLKTSVEIIKNLL